MIKAKLIDIGREKFNGIVEVENLEGLFPELEKHLLSHDLEIHFHPKENRHSIKAGSKLLVLVGFGMRPVGMIEILSINLLNMSYCKLSVLYKIKKTNEPMELIFTMEQLGKNSHLLPNNEPKEIIACRPVSDIRDGNDRFIAEGDLLTISFNTDLKPGFIYEVVFIDGAFRGRPLNDPNDDRDTLKMLMNRDNFIIIGNRWLNPKLLTKSKNV